MSAASQQQWFLVCRTPAQLCALPLECVVETMRPLPLETLDGSPPPVCGVAIIRGAPVPVVDVARVITGRPSPIARFVTLKVGDRSVALGVEDVVGVRAVPLDALHALPPLLRDAGADAIDAIGTLDEKLLIVLRAARLIPDSVWGALEPAHEPA